MKTISAAAVAALVIASTVPAVPVAAKSDNAATVLKGDNCTTGFAGFLLVSDYRYTETKNGNASLTCNGVADGDPDIKRPIEFRGYNCFAFGKVTTRSRVKLMPSGQFTVSCHFAKD